MNVCQFQSVVNTELLPLKVAGGGQNFTFFLNLFLELCSFEAVLTKDINLVKALSEACVVLYLSNARFEFQMLNLPYEH